jgi:hypothetical protein
VAKGRLFAMIGNARAWNAASARASDSRIRGADIRSPQTQQMAFCAMLSAHDSIADKKKGRPALKRRRLRPPMVASFLRSMA